MMTSQICLNPGVFAQPIGDDFPAAVVSGLCQRLADQPPSAMANVTLIVNTTRMMRRIMQLFADRPPGFLPRIITLAGLERLHATAPLPSPRSSLKRRLQLAALIKPILQNHPELAAQSSLFALTDSLAALLDEMQGEGVGLDPIEALDVADMSGHWQNAKTLIEAAHTYVTRVDEGMDNEARQRALVMSLIETWQADPPSGPIVLAGSTGSRGTTFELMKAIATLDQGAVILPGFDRDMPASVWTNLSDPFTGEDHPQFRFARLLEAVGLAPNDIPEWTPTNPVSKARNNVISLSLRPAPVTAAWLKEGPNLPNLPDALQDVTLLEAPTQRIEALVIAMRLRKAAEDRQPAALITPDRLLGRQVAAALDRWNIEPDDSAGAPLHLSAPGRFLRHTAALFLQNLNAESLLTLLKHPLTASSDGFERHGLFTQRLELQLRRDRVPNPTKAHLEALIQKAAKNTDDGSEMEAWSSWLCPLVTDRRITELLPLSEWLDLHRALAEALAGQDAGGLWDKAAGRAALSAVEDLETNAEHAGALSASDYTDLLTRTLSQGEVRDRDAPHPDVMIWGTMEARVQGAELVILGGLNEGSWPETPSADPWLNRQMRLSAGLLLPDRRIGLAAHDYQQAMGAPEVWITRSLRSDDSETVPARWVNRLTNLVGGLPMRDGPKALEEMRNRGRAWIAKANQLETVEPVEPAQRAAPRPPVKARPRNFSVTEIKTLIRDPYAIYAKHCLGLRPLDPLVQEPDAPIRGIVIHKIMEHFLKDVMQDRGRLTPDHLMAVADRVLEQDVPWGTERMLWRARLARICDWVVEGERARLSLGTPALLEEDAKGYLELPAIGGSIRGRADRIDMSGNSHALIYDYKSGAPPSDKEQKHFDKQLALEAAMVEAGGFDKLGTVPVDRAEFIGLGANPKVVGVDLEDESAKETLDGLIALISGYLSPSQHFLSRRMMQAEAHSGDYDHLARFGEWTDADKANPEDLT